MERVHVFLLSAGYVESHTLGTLILIHDEGFETAEDGLQSLAAAFLAVKVREQELDFERSRRSSRTCPHCSMPIEAVKPGDVFQEELAERIHDAVIGQIDGSGELWGVLNALGWDLDQTVVTPEQFSRPVVVHQYGDEILAAIAVPDPEIFALLEDWETHIRVPEGFPMRRPKVTT